MSSKRKILVTCALPYANASLHIGHVVEHVQTDIWVRFQRLRGAQCWFVCASDAHGTPTMLRAAQEGVDAEQLIRRVSDAHRKDFETWRISVDSYTTTHDAENEQLTNELYRRLAARDLIARKVIAQAYDLERAMFLPDRYVRGTCPYCGTPDQYGDSCENCGQTYSPLELKDPVSTLSGTKPAVRESEHLFLKLAPFHDELREWVGKHVDAAIARKLEEWFKAGLKDWDISRDAPYFGFRIPGERDKYFYVWFDAPIGYQASFLALCRRTGLDFGEFWDLGSQVELYHFIGKDIPYFHALFWPAMLSGAGYRKPSGLFVHGHLTIDGKKMSKRSGTFIPAAIFAKHLDPDYLRYYYASKLSAAADDLDLNLADFVAKVNSDLVGKLVNIASRCAGFVHRLGDGRLATVLPDARLYAEFAAAADTIADDFEKREYSRAVRTIMALADRANQYIDERKPWLLAKNPGAAAEVVGVCTLGLNLFRALIVYLKPILPAVAARAEQLLGGRELVWDDAATPLLGTAIARFEPLLQRVDESSVAAILEDTRQAIEAAAAPPPAAPPGGAQPAVAAPASAAKPTPAAPPASAAAAAPSAPGEIDLDQFLKTDLRVARVVEASLVEGADKLLRLTLDAGAEQRTVFAGIRSGYEPAELVGKLVVLVANLAPRKMRFGISQGMVLAASAKGEGVFLLSPDSGAKPGMKVS
ncbi:MAG TPA: methionine--tRNA ligase [Gammaproteobacteria bacterium]|nr:methionine--tRNA ligase [Gammaproteobacteria bacterium]